jgi:meiosis induction protein kinase IME2/SME1
LRNLPTHPHLVPALDIFLDPLSKKLHICMEYMDGNLYQLMKARDHRCMDGRSVKSILFQILAGLNHIHAHDFFHRDIKPENILVSTSAPHDSSSAFSRYSALVAPPTPPAYTIKIADFGLARETQSKLPYTTYVSTRWYRAPEVLLRAGEYSAPVDIWAIGAMAVEIATLKPLFPGGNEVDQVWRVCEIMGSPGNWYNKSGARVGGGDWREGTRLAQKLGFSFPKVSPGALFCTIFSNVIQMAPHSIDTILPAPQWPASFSSFVTWCLMWDPKNRPTSKQALDHEYFADAVDPLRPKSSTARLLGRKQSDLSFKSFRDTSDSPTISTKQSWFRRSLIARESAPAVPQHDLHAKPVHFGSTCEPEPSISKTRPVPNKRSTWANGAASNLGAPMPILPSIRPISPLSNAVTAQASGHVLPGGEEKAKKIGRQLSLNSHGNHYGDGNADRGLNGNRSPLSPLSSHRESFFSHLRKRARRFSGRHGVTSPHADDLEANAATESWSNRSSIVADTAVPAVRCDNDFTELDKALQSVQYSLEHPANETRALPVVPSQVTSLKRHHSLQGNTGRVAEANSSATPISSRARRALQMTSHPIHRYETPEEEDELLDEVLNSANAAATRLAQYSKAEEKRHRSALMQMDKNHQSVPKVQIPADGPLSAAYPTPSPSAKRNGVLFGQESTSRSQPVAIAKPHPEVEHVNPQWPTPPYEENEWGAAAAASIFAAGMVYR